MNVYATKTIQLIRRGLQNNPNFILDTFFPNRETVQDEEILLEIELAGNQMAPFVSPIENGRIMIEKGYQSNLIMAPSLAPKHVITPKDMFKRNAGDNITGGESPASRQSKNAGRILAKQELYIKNREEYMAGQFLTLGKIKSAEGDHQYELNYQMPHIHTLVAGEKWNEANVNPLDTIDKFVDECEESGTACENIIMGSLAAKHFNNSEVLNKQLDIRNKQFMTVELQKKYPGIVYMGFYEARQVHLYAYNRSVMDSKGVKKAIIPPNMIVGGPSGGTILYAPVVYHKNEESSSIHEEIRYSSVQISESGKEKTIVTESRPVFKPLDLSSYFSAIVCDEE